MAEEKIKKTKVVKEKVAKAAPAEVAQPKQSVDAYETVKFVLMTEKSVRAVEAQNKLVFIVKRDAKRNQIKQAVEKMFDAQVGDVKTVIDQRGRKKAFVKFKNAGAAGDIAIKLGII